MTSRCCCTLYSWRAPACHVHWLYTGYRMSWHALALGSGNSCCLWSCIVAGLLWQYGTLRCCSSACKRSSSSSRRCSRISSTTCVRRRSRCGTRHKRRQQQLPTLSRGWHKTTSGDQPHLERPRVSATQQPAAAACCCCQHVLANTPTWRMHVAQHPTSPAVAFC